MSRLTTVQVGKLSVVFDDPKVPGRRAPLKVRATWGSRYMRKLLAGERVTRSLTELAMRWIDEAIHAKGSP